MPRSFWADKRVLVTGANGFVGGWLAKALLDQRATVVTVVRDRVVGTLRLHGLREAVVSIDGDLTDMTLLARILNEYEIDSVFHLAAQSLVCVAARHPVSTFESNIRGTWTLLEQCRLAPSVHRIVVSTSDKVYGSHAVSAAEDTPLLGEFPYDASKVCADVIAHAYAATFGLPLTVLRCANIYGGGDLNYSRIVPYTVRNVLLGQPVLLRTGGSLRREYVYVDEAVEAFLTAAEAAGRADVRGQAFNCGGGDAVDVLGLVDRIIDIAGNGPIEVVRSTAQAHHEIPVQSLISTKADQRLGWRAAMDLDEGLRRTIEWYRSHLGP